MSELDQKFLDKIQELIQLGEQVKQTRYSKSTGNMVVIGDAGVDSGLAHQWGTSCLDLFRRMFGQDSVHYENFQAKFPRFHNYSPVTQALGVLRAAKDDYERGFLFDTRTLIEVEVFDDFPGARRALAWRWLLSARSSGGCILEDSLRKLCTRQEVALSVKPKLGTMNAGLAKQGVYNKLTQKRITALADIRNKAAMVNGMSAPKLMSKTCFAVFVNLWKRTSRNGRKGNLDADRVRAYWRSYLDTLPPDSPVRDEEYIAEGWGDSAEMADELGALIAAGTKTATCSALWEYEAEGSSLPETGLKTIVLDGNDEPLCIVETTGVEVRPYDKVDARFAYEEGEGDRSLEYWREAHWRFFSRTLPNIGKQPATDMPLVCERFRVVYR